MCTQSLGDNAELLSYLHAQASAGLGATAGNVQSSQDTAALSGLASDAPTSGGGVNAGGGSLSGQGESTGGGVGSDGVGGVSDTASLGNPGGLVFDGAGNIVSGLHSAFGDVPATYTGKQVKAHAHALEKYGCPVAAVTVNCCKWYGVYHVVSIDSDLPLQSGRCVQVLHAGNFSVFGGTWAVGSTNS